MKKILIRIVLILGILLIIAGIAWAAYGIYKKATLEIPNPVATIEVENYGTIKVELFPEKAPNTVANFIRLANRGFYNGSTFHRTMPDFVIQGGSKGGDTLANTTLSDIYDLEDVLEDKDTFEYLLDEFYDGEYTVGDSNTTITSYSQIKKWIEESEENKSDFEDFLNADYTIEGEFIANGDNNNNLKHKEGIISMARSDYSYYGYTTEGYNSANCQFFITTAESDSLDGLYAAFGKVTEGMDVVNEISNVEVYYREDEVDEDFEVPQDEEGNQIQSDTPKEQPVITSISVETFGVDYGAPIALQAFDISSIFANQYLQ